MLDLLEGADLAEPVVVALAALRNQNNYLRRLLADYATCGQLEQDVLEPELRACDTLTWLDEFVAGQQAVAAELGIELVVRFRSFVPDRVVIDPGLTASAFTALLHVAMQRTVPAQLGVSLQYVESAQQHESAQLVMECQTRGGGFDPIELGYVFAPFHVRDVAGRPLLGLSLGQRFAELLGGRVWVESVGTGACSYRMSLAAEPGEQAVWLDPVSRNGDFGPVRPGRILFVGRCDRTVARCSKTLLRSGYRVERAAREEVVWQRLQQQPERWRAVVVDATCTGDRLLGFVDAMRQSGFGGTMIALTENASAAGLVVPGVDAVMYAPNGPMLVQVLQR